MAHDGGIDTSIARFTRMEEGTMEDWGKIIAQELPFQARQADRLLEGV